MSGTPNRTSIHATQPVASHGAERDVETPKAGVPSFEVGLRRARADFHEMPGLVLTEAQASRLWALDAALCRAVIRELVKDGFLIARGADRFTRNDR